MRRPNVADLVEITSKLERLYRELAISPSDQTIRGPLLTQIRQYQAEHKEKVGRPYSPHERADED